MNLVSKLVEVMRQVKYIQKTGYNSFHKYKYATEGDVNERIREELAKLNVLMIPSVKTCTSRVHLTSKGNAENIVSNGWLGCIRSQGRHRNRLAFKAKRG